MITRLDEDLSTLGQLSKLSETVNFPHQVHEHKRYKESLIFIYSHLHSVAPVPFSL